MVGPSVTRADEFLATYQKLELWMRATLKRDATVPYKRLVDELQKHARITDSQRLQLGTFGYLRNALVHWDRDAHGDPVADPRQETLTAFSELVGKVMEPELAIKAIGSHEVVSLTPDDRVSDFLAIVRDQNFSQVPVLHGHKYAGVQTVGDIARWISTKWWPTTTDFRNTHIASVPRSQLEDPEFIVRDCSLTAPEAIVAFDVQAAEKAISGIVIVDRAEVGEVVRAMILPWDLPALIQATTG